jgi:hypothetical protein
MVKLKKKLCQSHPCTNTTTLTLTIRLAQWSNQQKNILITKVECISLNMNWKTRKLEQTTWKKKKEVRQCIQNKEV